MSLLLDSRGEVIIADAYTALADDAPLPDQAAVVVTLARWQAETAALLARKAAVAVRLPNTVNVNTLDAQLLARPLLVLDFPGFADGRAYSQASLLKRHGYSGKLRAAGAAVVADQLLMMRRCGIDEFAARDDQQLAALQHALAQSSPVFYQPTVTSESSVNSLRRS